MTGSRRASNRSRTIHNDEVIDAARAMLRQVPVGEFSVRELAKSMGVVPGTIYSRFGTKDELLAQLFRQRIDAMIVRLEELDGENIATMEAFLDVLAPEVGRIRLEFEHHFMREAAGDPAVTDETWREMRARFRVLSHALYAELTRLAANEGVTLQQNSVGRRLMWNVIASVPIRQSDIAYRHSNATYRRFVARALIRALAEPS